MIYRIRHTTIYAYSEPVSLCHNLARLKPRQTPQQFCLRSDLRIEPEPAVTTNYTDYFGNQATFFAIQEAHEKLAITANHVAKLTPCPPPDAEATPPWESVRDAFAGDHTRGVLDAYQFTFDSPYIRRGGELSSYVLSSFTPGRPILAAALDLIRRIHSDFTYDPRATTVSTPLAQVLEQRRGVCQDFAHLGIGCLRTLGLAARYVSGYLCTVPPPGRARLIGADASHAWLSIYCGPAGWVDLDPTNNQVPTDKHIHVAWGRDFDDVSPIKGVIFGGGQHTVSVAVDVIPQDAPTNGN